ncbi:MAG: ATP-binding protein [Arenibacterium sp.]
MNWRCRDFPATPSGARDGVVGLVSRLAEEGLSAESLGAVEIVLAEVVNNIVEHAYSDHQTGDVKVQYCLTSNALDLRVLDDGDGLPDNALPEGQLPSLEVAKDDLPEGGFGWSLIRTLASDVQYERKGGQNRLALRFDL